MDGESAPVASIYFRVLAERLERLISEALVQEMKFLCNLT